MSKQFSNKDLKILKRHETHTGWREKAEWRRENRPWLRYSGYIALAVMNRLDELNLTQKQLAERMNCTPQYITKIVRGSENLTLETISKLESCLDIDLIHTALMPKPSNCI